MTSSDPTLREEFRWKAILGATLIGIFVVVLGLVAVVFFAKAGQPGSSHPEWNAEHTRELIQFATLFLFGSLVLALLTTWYWGRRNRGAILREIKRLEAQIAEQA